MLFMSSHNELFLQARCLRYDPPDAAQQAVCATTRLM
jgi:hypothetical protein